ncbi:MAG TPA: helix-turn-helix domain-containing protein [Solirubrobacteraceae bacterium]
MPTGTTTRRPRGRRSGDATAVREALLAAARSEFAERGYEAASTRTILGEAGVTAPVLYHHFGNKAGLFEAVAEQVMDAVVGAFEDVAAPGAGLDANLDALLAASAELQARDPQLPRFIVAAPVDLARHPELAGAEAQMSRLRLFLEELCAQEREPKLAARVALTLIYGLSRYAATLGPREFASTVGAVRRHVLGGRS